MLQRLHKERLRMVGCLSAVAAFALAWAVYVLGDVALDRHNLTWLWGDLSQVHVAWGQFIADPHAGWLKTDRLSYPLSMSISLFDPMPILLLLSRPVAGMVADGQQFFGYYFVVCLVLQGVFGYLATMTAQRLLGGSHEGLMHYVAIVGGCLFASVPFTFSRFVGHTALSSQWVLALSIWVTLATLEGSSRRWLLLNGLVLFLATGLNPYLALLVLISNSIVVLIHRGRSGVGGSLGRITWLALVVIVGLELFGFASASGATTGGYGVYSMNMLGPLDSNGRASLFPLDVVDPTGGQSFEGYNYLGFGVLLLCGLALFSFVNHKAPTNRFPFVAALLVIAVCYLIALSTVITLSAHSFQIPVPKGVQFLLERFRGSGRLFWMAGLWLILVATSAITLRFGQLTGAALLTFLFAIQIVDVRPIAQEVRRTIANGKALSLDLEVTRSLSGIFVFPAWQCDPTGTPGGVRNYESVGRFALAHRIPTNNFYAARTTNDQTTFHCNIDQRLSRIDGNAVYLMSPEVYEAHGASFAASFQCAKRDGPQPADNYWICVPGANR